MSKQIKRACTSFVLLHLWSIVGFVSVLSHAAAVAEPLELVVRIPYADLRVVGTQHETVRVISSVGEDGAPLGLTPWVKSGKRVELVDLGNDRKVSIELEVPERANLYLESGNGGTITVVGVRGRLEIVTSNAGVTVAEVAGSLSISASNGPIRAGVLEVDPGGLVSLLTSNATIELALPRDFEGRILAETDGDEIESDFDVRPDSNQGLRRPGRVLAGEVGAGGPFVRLRTENASISIRATERPPRR